MNVSSILFSIFILEATRGLFDKCSPSVKHCDVHEIEYILGLQFGFSKAAFICASSVGIEIFPSCSSVWGASFNCAIPF